MAHVIVSKFCDHLPFYRQEKMFDRINVDLGRGAMSNWAMQVGKQSGPLMELMWREIRSGPLINIDETPVQVLKEPGRANTAKSWMPSRSGAKAQKRKKVMPTGSWHI